MEKNIVMEILSYGPDVKVIQPPHLVEEVKQAYRKALSHKFSLQALIILPVTCPEVLVGVVTADQVKEIPADLAKFKGANI